MPAHPNPPAVQRLDALEARVGALEAELRELRLLVGDICQALAEVALASVDDLGALNPTSPLHSSGHVQAKIARLFPATRAIVRDYLEHEDSYSGRLARTVASVQESHQAAEHGRADAPDRTREHRERMYRAAAKAGNVTNAPRI
jgi:hypothetical protein